LIEQVEDIESQLQRNGFPQLDVLEETRVDVVKHRSLLTIARYIAERVAGQTPQRPGR